MRFLAVVIVRIVGHQDRWSDFDLSSFAKVIGF